MPAAIDAARLVAMADGARSFPAVMQGHRLEAGERLASNTGYDAATRTVELITATETPVRMPGWLVGLDCEFYYEILDCSPGAVDMSQLEAGNAPLLDTHDRFQLASRLGVARQAQVVAAQVITRCAFGQSARAREVEAEFAGGTPPKVSVGYRRNQMLLDRMDGDVPVYRVTSWTLTEVSLVSIAADPDAGARSAQESTGPCPITETSMRNLPSGLPLAAVASTLAVAAADGARSLGDGIATRGPTPQPLPNPAPIVATPAPAPAPTPAPAPAPSPAPAPTPAPAPAPAPAPSAPGTEAGRSAVDRFTGTAALALIDQARGFGDAVVTRAQELIQQNERGEISTDGARAALLTAAADAQRTATSGITTGGRAIEVTGDQRDRFRQGAANSIIQRAGLGQLIADGARARGQQAPDLDPGEFRGIRNAELARMSLERCGQRVDSWDRDLVVGQAMALRMGPYQSTSDFPVILEEVVNRVLQAAYATTPDTWRQFAGVGSVSDFKATAQILLGAFGALDPLLENGEVKNKPIPDGAKATIQATTRANIIALTRQAIVNDDLGAFNDLAVALGRAGKLSIELDVYRLLALNNGLGPVMGDGKTLFHADHKNIVAGAGLSIDQIEAMDILFADQTDLSGEEKLDLRLSVLLTPYAYKGQATILNTADQGLDPTGKLLIPNRVKGTFDTIVGGKRLKGKRRYGFADPSIAPALKVVFLNGNQEPTVESRDGWRTDGTEWRVKFDYGVGAIDWRTAVTDAGE
ncbi:HK97 family phage prohead protease [uncultured Sphingomonas sp.]|uniref:phage major capsid protein n=1 Tax=uncultured Sphingomonas sp. TaxID=158754 RepID=UPI002634368D|nr:HK97 family phage prohead protease [uncultured Sphingomonas sp.]